MIRVSVGGMVDAPLGNVWNFMVDLDTMAQRDPSVLGVSWQRPLRVGSVATIGFRQMGKRTGRYEVLELEPNHKLGVQMTALGARLVGKGVWLFEPVAENKTRLSASVQIDVRGLPNLVSPLFSISAGRGARREFDRIRRAEEAGSNGDLQSTHALE